VKEDFFKDAVKSFCKRNDMSPQKTRFSKHDDLITISVKNHSENGLDIDCFKVLNFMIGIIGPRKTKFSQSTVMFADSEKVDKVMISFEKKDYEDFLDALFSRQ